jgi:acetyl esterase/lipase
MLLRLAINVVLLAIAGDAVAQAPQEIRLWPGKAPGSENWLVPEVTTTSPTGDRTITNVSDPTVTVFLPAAEGATGAAVVVAPGGALRLLGWDNEGVKVAQWLNSKGIAALVLKYRTLQTTAGSGR